jgi:hypothetical protein
VDHQADFPMQDVLDYARDHDRSFEQTFWRELLAREHEDQERIERSTICEALLHINSSSYRLHDHSLYIGTARVGAGDGNVGGQLLACWYDRNIHIFANLLQLLEPDERILLIIGSGHVQILRELIAHLAGTSLVEPSEYLSAGWSQRHDA